MDTDYIIGMAEMEKGVKILLNIDRVLSKTDCQEVASAALLTNYYRYLNYTNFRRRVKYESKA